MEIIDTIIMQDTYLPAKRSAILILSQLICGFDKLQDFEDILLPIFRALKYVLANEVDSSTRIHATTGLQHLQVKVKAFLTVQPMEKEIKIVGINDKPKDKNPNILELN